ncbi:MAG: autoinducer binding domain-containing protein [Acetobacter indonesiensis]|nr:autoinducer binding domain-containing protein [Acetobacter indonesiensis]MCI1546982.1 autoinducer binding domain-containing protein [Acetobacter indonesiensis]MCI1766346.1 autoinducer binding domain-containing protein [Acetobacter indonesiensis]
MKPKPPSFLIAPATMQALITRITEATSLAELQAIVADIPQKTGVQNIVYHYLGQQPDGASETPRGLTTYADEWVTHYIAKGYVHSDPVIRRAETSLVPFDWGELSIEGDDQKKLFREATDFNLGATGLSMPVRGLGGAKALFTITSEYAKAFSGPIRIDYLREYQVLGVYVHEAYMRLTGLMKAEHQHLSQAELASLKLAADGLPGPVIAQKLKLPESVVRLYIRLARHKLFVADTSAAIEKARALGLI